MTTVTTLTSSFEALEGLFFTITPDPDFLSGSGRERISAGAPARGRASPLQPEDQTDDVPIMPLRDRWSF